MTKNDALKLFYDKNSLDVKRVCDKNSADFDIRLSDLPEQIDKWLKQIDKNDWDCFLKCLSDYTYLTQAQCEARFEKIMELLIIDIFKHNINLSDVLLVTAESASGRKSGGDNVRSDLHKRNLDKISKDQIIEQYSKFSKSEFDKYKAVVFIDDIIGSGCTFWKMFCGFQKRFPNVKKCRLYYSCLVPTRKGVEHINKNFSKSSLEAEPLFDENWYQAPYFDKGSDEYKKIEKYEKEIDEYFEDSFFMGFNKARLLTSFYYNTPNNTISSFWREAPCNNPPFKRDGNQQRRLVLDDLKRKKKTLSFKAYSVGIYRKEKDG